MQRDTSFRIIKFQGTASATGKALAVVALATATTCCSIKQATHDVGASGVTMAEAEEDLVAYLWDKYKTAVAFTSLLLPPSGVITRTNLSAYHLFASSCVHSDKFTDESGRSIILVLSDKYLQYVQQGF